MRLEKKSQFCQKLKTLYFFLINFFRVFLNFNQILSTPNRASYDTDTTESEEEESDEEEEESDDDDEDEYGGYKNFYFFCTNKRTRPV